jgi:hypothetical protein
VNQESGIGKSVEGIAGENPADIVESRSRTGRSAIADQPIGLRFPDFPIADAISDSSVQISD